MTNYHVDIESIKAGERKHDILANRRGEAMEITKTTTAAKKETEELKKPIGRHETSSATEKYSSSLNRLAAEGNVTNWTANISEINNRCKSRKSCYTLSQ